MNGKQAFVSQVEKNAGISVTGGTDIAKRIY